MKDSTFFLFLSILLLAFGCNKTSQDIDDPINFKLSSISFTDCITSTKSTGSDSPSIHLKKQDNDYLLISAKNTEFCCGTESITINENIYGNEIIIEIIDNGPYTLCYCPHDADFLIGPLAEMEYSTKFIESENSYSRDTINGNFDFATDIDIMVSR
jgi:hypothetical protein